MKRRKFLLGVGSAAAAGSALIGSGAFSRVEADRSVTIQVAEDPNAYLGMDKCRIDGSETPNSSFAHLDDLGHLKIVMDPENPTRDETPLGKGVNSDSTSWFHNVFQLCNQGKEDACVWIEDDEDWPTVGDAANGVDGVDPEDRRVDFYLGADDSQSIIGKENAIGIPLGECRCIGIKTRTYGLNARDAPKLLEDLDNEIQINADVNANCTTEPPETITETGRLSLAYEDLPREESDWDYNDWIVDIFGTFNRCGEGGTGGVSRFQWDIVPQARGAGDTHKFEFDFGCSGEYEVTYYDSSGNEQGSSGVTNFSGNAGTVDITIWDDTSKVLSDLSNQNGDCETPDEWAQLEVRFDECCEFGTFNGDFETHGDDLPFNPILDNTGSNSSVKVEKGDIRLLVVPEQWEWPTGGEHIADAYHNVTRDSDGKPEFPSGWQDGGVDANRVTSCNFEVDETDNSIESS